MYRMCQHVIPKFMNISWKKTHVFGVRERAVHRFLNLYKEKLWNVKRKTIKFVATVPILLGKHLYVLFLVRGKVIYIYLRVSVVTGSKQPCY